MRFTDPMILETHARIASGMAEDPFLAVCHEILGYTLVDGFLQDDSEYRAFEARYQELITPAIKNAVGIQRALKSARIALEHEWQATRAIKDPPLDQWFRLQDIVTVLQDLAVGVEKPSQGSSSSQA